MFKEYKRRAVKRKIEKCEKVLFHARELEALRDDGDMVPIINKAQEELINALDILEDMENES